MRDGQFAIFCALLLLVPGLAASDQSSGGGGPTLLWGARVHEGI
jgi:hypothetical protein